MPAAILIVEDDALIREVMEYALKQCDHTVSAFGSGMEALRFLAESPRVDLIVLDLVMPTFSGWELLAEIRAQPRYRDVPVLVTSALAPPPTGVEVQGYLQKPFDLDHFLETIERLAAKPATLEDSAAVSAERPPGPPREP